MCGIAGLVDFSGLKRATAQRRLEAALQRMAARGPDGAGYWFGSVSAFAHRRLAIIALGDEGAQPMHSHGYVVTFNGEIFNYRELRSELERAGVQFETRSDTEVILAGWKKWGEGLLNRIVGMFAFGLWNPITDELVLARDRFGEKPLLYKVDGSRLAFASEFLALEETLGGKLPLNQEAIAWYFALRYIPDPLTIGEGARKLEPGKVAYFSRSGVRLSTWYDVGNHRRPPASGHWRGAIPQIRAAVDAAVADRLVSDVPVGAFLSGGINSAIVAASMAAAGGRVRSFTVGFEGVSDYYEERPMARLTAQYIGAEHTEIGVPMSSIAGVFDDVISGSDEPFADSSALAQFIVSRETRRSVTVALSGDGADETFGGYRKYQGERFAEMYRRLPSWLRKGIIRPIVDLLPEDKDSHLLERFRRLRRFVRHADADASGRQAGWMQEIGDAELADLIIQAPATDMVGQRMRALHARFVDFEPLTRHFLADLCFGLPGDMLVKVDRMSMANSLEVRSPFLDQRVVELAAALPDRWKLRGTKGKWILRQSFRDRLPPQLFKLPKRGFEVPVASLFRGPLQDAVRGAADPDRLKRQGLFRSAPVQRWIAELGNRRVDQSWKIWALVVFQRWLEINHRPEAA